MLQYVINEIKFNDMLFHGLPFTTKLNHCIILHLWSTQYETCNSVAIPSNINLSKRLGISCFSKYDNWDSRVLINIPGISKIINNISGICDDKIMHVINNTLLQSICICWDVRIGTTHSGLLTYNKTDLRLTLKKSAVCKIYYLVSS